MKKYCYRYGSALSCLAIAVEKDKHSEMEKWLREVHSIRKNWTNSRWRLLRDVEFILDKKQFARFLIFSERLPAELHSICIEVWNPKG